MLKTAPDRPTLQRCLILLILLAVTAVIIGIGLRLSVITQDIHIALIERTVEQARMALKIFTKPIADALIETRTWGRENRSDLSDIPALNTRFGPLLEKIPHLAAIMLTDDSGREYRLTRNGAFLITRLTGVGAQEFRRWQDGKQTQEWAEESDYDPRTRPWFRGVLSRAESDAIYWTSPYTFFSSREPGITGAVRWGGKGTGRPFRVAAFDVLLADLLKIREALLHGDKARVFLLDERTDIGEMSVADLLNETDDKNGTAPELSLKSRAVAEAVNAWQGSGRPGESFTFKSDGQRWWGGFRPLSIGTQNFWMGVLVPEKDLMPEMSKQRRLLIALMAGVLALGILLTTLLLWKFRLREAENPFRRQHLYDSEENLRALIREGESDTLEFKSTMRWNLKTDKAGKEMELAWLKTVAAYMNTDGGILIIGVRDDGTLFGLEADRFQNDDKCLLHFNNLITRHIGLEFSKYLRFEIRPVADKRVFIVECSRSEAPVFLKNGESEDFYIRSGPSSIKLSMSKMLKYLAEHSK
ncbi:ATP-binding protein [Desulfonema ishimotonii]|uniref:ATP-binding protein n=1 Tax=Desulfonema ishimotonii TaxID=45657 RepID=A0A401G3B0_9BACT|nr:RNA-binding domain-containing protein [Desulfonema ishimotonii]GBC63727.1 ATP-binding protein [Desulfonema ishimotonii]